MGEYEWRRKHVLTPSEPVNHELEQASIGADIKITPENQPYIIEYHADTYGVHGFRDAFTYGSVEDVQKQYAISGKHGFSQFLSDYARKDKTHEVLDAYMPRLLDAEEAAERGDALVVAKPRSGGGGEGVEIMQGGDFIERQELPEAWVVEEFIPSKPVAAVRTLSNRIGGRVTADVEAGIGSALFYGSIGSALLLDSVEFAGVFPAFGAGMVLAVDAVYRMEHRSALATVLGKIVDTGEKLFAGAPQPENFDGCMRHVTGITVEEDCVVVEDIGGYWRTAKKPVDRDASYNDRFIANLSNGTPVPATDEDLLLAEETMVNAVSTLYQSWLRTEGYDGLDVHVESV